jgi:hypothetical protein
MNILVNLIFLFYFFCPVFLQNNTDSKILSEFIVVDEDFEHLLDIIIDEYNQCKNKKKGHHFTITIGEFKDEEYSGIKSLSICESNYKDFVSFYDDFVSDGYGFVYHKGHFFILYGLQLNNVFKKTDKIKMFSCKQELISTFDPPRWLYYYLNKEFYLVDSSPCGG